MDALLPLRVTGAVAAALALAGAPGAHAQQPQTSPFRQFLSASGEARAYATPDGRVRFVFDRSGGRAALVQFQGDPEVHVLRPVITTGGAGGAEIYQSESGDIGLRVLPHGGITVFLRSLGNDGAPAAEEGQVAPLMPRPTTPALLQARFRDLQNEARRRLGRNVTFVAPQLQPSAPAAGGVILDAAERAADGIAALPPGIRQVVFIVGSHPAAAIRGDTLFIQVAPALGYAGRPSSASIRTVVQHAVQGPEQ
jgi:Domain of unknown function (DUF4908)